MKRALLVSLGLVLAPLAVGAAPVVGDVVGSNAEEATKALEAAGCPVLGFESEDGQIEAQCTDTATGKVLDLYIDPKTGIVTDVKQSDD